MKAKPAYIVIREGSRDIHRQRVGAHLRIVGPARTEFDYWCFMLKIGRLYFIISRYHYGVRVQLQWWPSPLRVYPYIKPARTLLHVFRLFRQQST